MSRGSTTVGAGSPRDGARANASATGAPRVWPDGARCVVFLSVDLDGVSLERGEGIEPLGVNSIGTYAYRCGVPRYVRLFERKRCELPTFLSLM